MDIVNPDDYPTYLDKDYDITILQNRISLLNNELRSYAELYHNAKNELDQLRIFKKNYENLQILFEAIRENTSLQSQWNDFLITLKLTQPDPGLK